MKFKFKKNYEIKLAKTLDKHWYQVWAIGKTGKKRSLGYFPSSTTILNAYPQSPHLTKWIAERGWNESQKIKSEAGERGTRVHLAIERLFDREELHEHEFSVEEWYKITAFVDWHNEYQPKDMAGEMKVFSSKYKFAGTVDRIVNIGGQIIVLDWKTSSSIHNHFPLQFGSYAQAIEEMTDLKIDATAVLQLGAKNKNNYRFVIYPDWKDHLKVFLNVMKTWVYDNKRQGATKVEAPVLDLPDKLKLKV